jgi:hypothetical protein
MKDVAAGHHVGLHAGLRAQDAGHVLGLRAHQGGGGFVPMLGNPAAAGHGFLPRLLASTSVIHFAENKSAPKNTSGERWKRSPDVLPLCWRFRYFFFALLCGLLRGRLLRCFLGCHFPILPFDDFASTCKCFLQLMNV